MYTGGVDREVNMVAKRDVIMGVKKGANRGVNKVKSMDSLERGALTKV